MSANNQKPRNTGLSILYCVLTLAAVKFFGPLPALVGCLAGFVVKKILSKGHPSDNLPAILGIVVGIVVAFAASIGFAVVLYNMK